MSSLDALMRKALAGDRTALDQVRATTGAGFQLQFGSQLASAEKLARQAERDRRQAEREAEREQRSMQAAMNRAHKEQKSTAAARDREQSAQWDKEAVAWFTDKDGRRIPITAPSGAPMRRYGKSGTMFDPVTGIAYVRDDNGRMVELDPERDGKTVVKNGHVYKAGPGLKWKWMGYDKKGASAPDRGLARELSQKTAELKEQAQLANGELALVTRDLASDRRALADVQRKLKDLTLTDEDREGLQQREAQLEGSIRAKTERQAQAQLEAYRANAEQKAWAAERKGVVEAHLAGKAKFLIDPATLPNTGRLPEHTAGAPGYITGSQRLAMESIGLLPSGDWLKDAWQTFQQSDLERATEMAKGAAAIGGNQFINQWTPAVDRAVTPEATAKLSAQAEIALPAEIAKATGVTHAPPEWFTLEAMERQATARFSGLDAVQAPPGYRLEDGQLFATKEAASKFWGVTLPWSKKTIEEPIGKFKFDQHGVGYIELDPVAGHSPSFAAGQYYRGAPEYLAVPADFAESMRRSALGFADGSGQYRERSQLTPELRAELDATNWEEAAEKAWLARRWSPEQVRDTLDRWTTANDAERSALIAELDPRQAHLPPQDRFLDGAWLHREGFVSAQEARLMMSTAYGTDPGFSSVPDAFASWVKEGRSAAAAAYREQLSARKPDSWFKWLADRTLMAMPGSVVTQALGTISSTENMRIASVQDYAAREQFMAEYYQEARRKVDFNMLDYVAARDKLLAAESWVGWATNALNNTLTNAFGSSAGIFVGSGKLVLDGLSKYGVPARQLTDQERELLGAQTEAAWNNLKRSIADRMPESMAELGQMLSLYGYLFNPDLADKLWHGKTAAAVKRELDDLEDYVHAGNMTEEGLRDRSERLQAALVKYHSGYDLRRFDYENNLLDPRSALAQSLGAYLETGARSYWSALEGAAFNSQFDLEIQERAAHYASANGMIAESAFFGPLQMAFRGGQVAPLTEHGIEIASALAGVGMGRLLTLGKAVASAQRAGLAMNRAGREINRIERISETIFEAGKAKRQFGQPLTQGQRARNFGVDLAKQGWASGGGEAFEEAVAAFTESGATIGDAIADGLQGFIGGVGLGAVHRPMGAAWARLDKARYTAAQAKALDRFVADWNTRYPENPITREQAQTSQAYQPVAQVREMSERLRAVVARDLALAGEARSLPAEAAKPGPSGATLGPNPRLAEIAAEREALKGEYAATLADMLGVSEAALATVREIGGLTGEARDLADAAVRLVSGTPLTPAQEQLLLANGVYARGNAMIIPDSLRAVVGESAPHAAATHLRTTEAEQLAQSEAATEAVPPPLPPPAQPAPVPRAATDTSTAPPAPPAPTAPARAATEPQSQPAAPETGGSGVYAFSVTYTPKGSDRAVTMQQTVTAANEAAAQAKADARVAGLRRVGEVSDVGPLTLRATVDQSAEAALSAKPTGKNVLGMVQAAVPWLLGNSAIPVKASSRWYLRADDRSAISAEDYRALPKAERSAYQPATSAMFYMDGNIYVDEAKLAHALADIAPADRAAYLDAVVREEVRHAATVAARTTEQLAEDWNTLPESARQRVIETYYASRLAKVAGQDWRKVEVNPVQAGAEFWRMYLSAIVEGNTTEQLALAADVAVYAKSNPAFAERFRRALADIARWLREELLGQLDEGVRAEFEAVAESIEAEVAKLDEAMGRTEGRRAPEPEAQAPESAAPVVQNAAFVPADNTHAWTPQALGAAIKNAAAAFGYRIVDTGIDVGVVDRWGKNVNLGTAMYDKLVPGSEVGRWIDKIENSAFAAEIAEKMAGPGLHRVWFGHDFAVNLGTVVGEFGISAIPDYILQLLKDSLTKSGIPLPGVELLVRGDVVSDRTATDWLSMNIGEAFGAGVAFFGTYQLYRASKKGALSRPRVIFATVGVGIKAVAGVLTAQPFLIISGLADAAIMVGSIKDVRAAFNKAAEVAKTRPPQVAAPPPESAPETSTPASAPQPVQDSAPATPPAEPAPAAEAAAEPEAFDHEQAEYEARKAMEEEAMEEYREHMGRTHYELLEAIRELGGLPALSSRNIGPWRGEIRALQDMVRMQSKGVYADKKRKGMLISDLFRRNAKDVDRLVAGLREMGFELESESDLFDLVQRRLHSAEPIFGTRFGPEMMGAAARAAEGQHELFDSSPTDAGRAGEGNLFGHATQQQQDQAQAEQDAVDGPDDADLRLAGETTELAALDEDGSDVLAPVTPQAPAQASRGLQDFGEELHGARKHIWQRWRDAAAADLPADVKDISVAEHFPPLNYAKLLEEGADPGRLAAIAALRDMIPRRPVRGWKLSRWGDTVRSIHAAIQKLADADQMSMEAFEAALDKTPELAHTVRFYQALGYPAFTAAKGITAAIRSGVSYYYGKNVPPGSALAQLNEGNRMLPHYSLNPDPAAAIRELADQVRATLVAKAAETPAKSKAPKLKLSIYRVEGGTLFIGTKHNGRVVRLKSGFQDFKDADAYRKDHREELAAIWKQMRQPLKVRTENNLPRRGRPRRENATDVSPDQFQDMFGFRGVQFGNYVEGDRRQSDLNQAYDALLDLAEVVGVPPQALSLEGRLGLAFGARGTGGAHAAAAHYEPTTIVINLTKTHGAGSLAHEWFHALDHYFARLDLDNLGAERAIVAYATQRLQPPGKMRPEVYAAFQGIRDAIRRTDGYIARSRELDQWRKKPYWTQPIELAARAFEIYSQRKLAASGVSNDYLANISKAGRVAYPTSPEMESGIEAAFDQLFTAIDTRQTKRGTALFAAEREAPNGQPSQLAPADHALVRTDAFKASRGDWEALARRNAIEGLSAVPIEGGAVSADQAEAFYRAIRDAKTSDGRPVDFPRGIFGKLAGHKNKALIFRAVPKFDQLLLQSIRAYSEAERRPSPGSIIKEFHNYVAKALIDRAEYFVRFTIQELKDARNQFHNAFVADAEITRADNLRHSKISDLATKTGSSPDIKLRAWWHSVNPDSVTVRLDQNGEPTAAEVARYRQETGQPTPLAADPRAESLTPDQQKLVEDHTRLADQVAAGYRNIPGVDHADVQQEARVGLAMAAMGFDAARGVPFGGYAARAIKNRLNSLYREQRTLAEREAIELDAPISSESPATVADVVPAPERARAAPADLAIVREVMATLPDRPRRILERAMNGEDWRSIGEAEGISHEGARKIARGAQNTLRAQLRKRGVNSVEDIFPDTTEAAPYRPDSPAAAEPVRVKLDDEAVVLGAAPKAGQTAAVAEQAAIEEEARRAAEYRRAANQPRRNNDPLFPSARELYTLWLRGRLDKLDFYAPGAKDIIRDHARSETFVVAAINSMMDQMRDDIMRAFGYPKFWSKHRGRLTQFLDEILPTAARLEVAELDNEGRFVFRPFDMRVGTIPASKVRASGAKAGDTIVTDRGTLIIGPKVENDRHVLLRPMSVAVQQQIYEDFHRKYPEAAHYLDRWIMPGMEAARYNAPDGTMTAEFNRHSLRDLFNEWPPELRDLFGDGILPDVDYVAGYTPDVAEAKTLTAMIGSLLSSFRSGARKFKAGEARESGNIKNLFDGFSVRAMEAHREKIRVVTRQRLLEAAAVPVNRIPADRRADYVDVDVSFAAIMEAVRLARRLNPSAYPALTGALSPQNDKQLAKIFGDAYRLRGRGLMIHKAVQQELMLGAARQVTNNLLTQILSGLLERYNSGLLSTPFTAMVNWASNEYFIKPVRIANRLFYAILSMATGNPKAAKIGAYEAMFLLRGYLTDHGAFIAPWGKSTRARLQELIPKEMFDDQTRLQDMGIDHTLTVAQQLKRVNLGGAFLVGIGYGDMDARGKQKFAYAAYRAHAEVAWNEAWRRGEVSKDTNKREWTKEWVKAQPPEFHRDVYETAVLYLMDYLNVPAWLDPGQSNTAAGQITKRALLPFAKWPYNMARQIKRLSLDSALTLLVRGKTKDQRISAVANLAAMGGVAAVGAFIARADTDDDPAIGSNLDSEARALEAAYRTANRVNLSRMMRVIFAHGLMRDVEFTYDDGTGEPKDLWWRYRNYPYLKEGIVAGLFAEGRTVEALEALWDVSGEYVSLGILAKIVGLSEFDRHKGAGYRIAEAGLDLATAGALPTPWRRYATEMADPIRRKDSKSETLGYAAGPLDALRANTPWLSQTVPSTGRRSMAAFAPFSAAQWFKNQSRIVEKSALPPAEKAGALDALRAQARKMAMSPEEQRAYFASVGLPVDRMNMQTTSAVPSVETLRRLREMGIGSESYAVTQLKPPTRKVEVTGADGRTQTVRMPTGQPGRTVLAVPDPATVATLPRGLQTLRFFGGVNLKAVPRHSRKSPVLDE